MTGTPIDALGHPGATWRPSATVLSVLAMLALFLVPATLEAPARAEAVADPDGSEVVDPGGVAAPDAPAPDDGRFIALPPELGGVVVPLPTGQNDNPPGLTPTEPSDPDEPLPPGDQELPEPTPPEDSLLATLAEAIPVPPNLPIPELPEELGPFADSVAPAMFLVCSAAALPGGLAGVARGLAGDPIPGMSDLIGTLLLYQVPILDLCLIFGFPSELVECEVDEQVTDNIPGEVPVAPPPPAGSMLGVLRGVEGTLAGDTSGSDQFLQQLGCEARPS